MSLCADDDPIRGATPFSHSERSFEKQLYCYPLFAIRKKDDIVRYSVVGI